MAGPLECVLFDFDYTLADASEGILACIGYALEAMGWPAIAPERARATIGLSLPATFQMLTAESDPELGQRFSQLFLQRSEQVMVPMTRVFPAVAPTLMRLKQAGLALAIVSTKYRRRITAVLAREGLEAAIDLIVGGEDVTAHKPDPQGLCLALERLGMSPSVGLYVGDSVVDAEAAQRAGLDFVAVLSGVTPCTAFSGQRVRAFARNLDELPALLDV